VEVVEVAAAAQIDVGEGEEVVEGLEEGAPTAMMYPWSVGVGGAVGEEAWLWVVEGIEQGHAN